MNGTVSNTLENINSETNLNNIWSHILQEVQNSTKKSPPPKSIILVGDNESGRTTLISRLKGVESISKGVGLEYHYIDIKDEDRDDTSKLGVWVPDGDGTCNGLLKFALNETNIENSLIIFVVSMSTPWNIMESLKKWSNLIKEHVKKLNIDQNLRTKLLDKLKLNYQNYQEPDENSQTNSNNNNKNTSLANNNTQQAFSNNKTLPTTASVTSTSDDLLPLDPSILISNLGVETIVIVTKSDSISILDKENEYRVEHFDFIQYSIRKFCLEFGAALFYTTVKDKRPYDKLYKYILHKLYNYSFNYPSCVVDRESIFIPSGWDNESKINILLENITSIKVDSDYTEIISKPSIRKPLQRDNEVIISATDDQDFLSKLQIQLNKAASPSVKQEEIQSNTPITATTSPKTPPHKTPTKSSTAGPDSNNLKSFFQNLLAKNAPNNNTNTSTTPTSINQILQGSPTTPGNDQLNNETANDIIESESSQLSLTTNTDAITSS